MTRDEGKPQKAAAPRRAWPAPTDDLRFAGAGAERVIILASALSVVAFWTAPLVGVPVVAAAAAATLAFAALVAMLVRERRGERRRLAARETSAEPRSSRERFELLADPSTDTIVPAQRDILHQPVMGAPEGIVGDLRGVDERHEAEAATRSSEAVLRGVIDASPFSPEALARGCADILRGYAGTKALDIEVEFGERLPAGLVGDEGRLRQVLLNLLNNAVKFTAQRRVVLRVSSLGKADADGEAGGETVRFEVADTGIGIPEDKQHRLFERFSQVDSSVARRFGGSGLGLAICKRVVELMGGTIGVASREGEGSTFWFAITLPPSAVGVSAPLPVARPGAPRAARILVVEDIEINQRLAVALLEALGHAVDVAGDGAQAVAAVAAGSYDLVLMDVQMPGMDGVTATRLIRASGGPHRAVPIVAMTANVFPEQVRAFRAAGMDGHLGKPLSRAQLHAAVARWAAAADGSAAPAPEGRGELPLDEAACAQLGTYLGPARLDDVLARLAASLPQRFYTGSMAVAEDLRRWKADPHVVLSVAGMAGLADLAARCRALEAASPGSENHLGAMTAVRAARDAAVVRVATLRRDLARRDDAA